MSEMWECSEPAQWRIDDRPNFDEILQRLHMMLVSYAITKQLKVPKAPVVDEMPPTAFSVSLWYKATYDRFFLCIALIATLS